MCRKYDAPGCEFEKPRAGRPLGCRSPGDCERVSRFPEATHCEDGGRGCEALILLKARRPLTAWPGAWHQAAAAG